MFLHKFVILDQLEIDKFQVVATLIKQQFDCLKLLDKSIFLLYIFLKCMQEASPIMIQKSDTEYYLINNKGISLYYNDLNTNLSFLNPHKNI